MYLVWCKLVCVCLCFAVTGSAVVTFQDSLAAPTVHSGSNPRWLRPCRSAEEVALLGIVCDFRQNHRTESASGLAALKKTTIRPQSSISVAGAPCGCGRLSVWRWASSPAPSHSEEPWGEEPQIPLQARTRPARIWRLWHTLQAVDAALQFSDQDCLCDRVCHRPETERFLRPGWSSHRTKVCTHLHASPPLAPFLHICSVSFIPLLTLCRKQPGERL